MNLDSLLSESDPARAAYIPDPNPFDALAITSTSERAASTSNTRPGIQRRVYVPSLRPAKPALVAAVVVLIAASIAVPLGLRHSSSPPAKTTPSDSATPSGTWSLAGYISQSGWQLNSASGPLPTTQQFTTQLSCPTLSTCYSAGVDNRNVHDNSQGVISVTHDGGVNWQESLAPGHRIYFYNFSCPSANTCMVVGDVPDTNTHPLLYTTTDGGGHWTSAAMPGTDELPVLLSCATTLECAAVGLTQSPTSSPVPNAYFTSDGGHNWAVSTLPASYFPNGTSQSALECFPDGHCIAVGTNTAVSAAGQGTESMIYSVNGGASWESATEPSVPGIGLLSCADDTHCVSIYFDNKDFQVESGVLETNDGGATWSTLTATGLDSPSATTPMSIDSISCPTDADCWVSAHLIESKCQGSCPYVPDQAIMLTTSDGGLTWAAEPLPTPPNASLQYAGVYPVNCVSGNSCRAVGILELTKAAADAGTPYVQQDVVLTLTGGAVPIDSSNT